MDGIVQGRPTPLPPPCFPAKSRKQRLYACTCCGSRYLVGANGAAGERFCQPCLDAHSSDCASVLVLDSVVHLHSNDATIGIDVHRA